MAPAFDAICWDHDGLLVDTETLFFEATRGAFAEEGISITPERWNADYLSAGLGSTVIALQLGMNRSTAEAAIERRNRRYAEMLEETPLFCRDVPDTLRALHGRLPMAIVTGTLRRNLDTIHRHTGMLGLFTTIVTKEDFASPKPSPDAYLEAARRLGIPPSRCLAVEDSERGMNAALSAGMTCIVVPNDLTRGSRFPGAYSLESSVAAVPAHVWPTTRQATSSKPAPG